MSYQVLLVDDEQIYLRYLQEMIDWEKMDCRICGCAKDGGEAVRLAEEKKPDFGSRQKFHWNTSISYMV